MPTQWVAIRKALEKEEKRNWIPIERFTEICKANGILDRNQRTDLLNIFRTLGFLLNYKNPKLKGMVILNREWVTDALYRVLDDELVSKNGGWFRITDTETIWYEDKYEGRINELLALMQEFKLCFFNHSSKKYIVPVKLPITFNLDGLPPWDESNNVRLRLQYDWMPRAVATQLMVSLHEHIIELPTKDQWIWRRGAVLDGKQLEIDDVKVRITEDWKKKMIAIDAKGEHSELLIKAVMKNWREVNQPFAEKVKVTPVILCPCKECETSYMPHQFKYQNVLKAKRMKKELQCQESFEMLPAADVLKGLFDEVTVMLDDSRINIGEEMADLIGEGELAEVIRQLPKDEFTVGFEQRLKYLKKQELHNTLSFDEINRHRNKLVQNLLDYLNDEFFHQGRQ